MHTLLPRKRFHAALTAAAADPSTLRAALPAQVTLPPTLRVWLARLALLHGVPFTYLVPDERMLPPESVRFFVIDMNWVDALLDGAFSIGRSLSTDETALSQSLDSVVREEIRVEVQAAVRLERGDAAAEHVGPLTTITGFLLRSALVPAYPGLGVYAYGPGQSPWNNRDAAALPLLRLERLGQRSDTLIGLVDGEAAQVDIHEAPEHLHYGVASYTQDGGQVQATKYLRSFTRNGQQVTITDKPASRQEIGDCFRKHAPRTLKPVALADTITRFNNTMIDAAELGFVMTEGVGLVRFIRKHS